MNPVDPFAGLPRRQLSRKDWVPQPAVLVVLVVCLTFNRLTVAADGAAFRDRLLPFLHTHCMDCHQGTEAAGGLDLATFGTNLTDAEVMRRWVLIHDRVSAGEMPPEGQPRPAEAQTSAAIATLSAALTKADRARSDVVLRRLNRNEYENTVRDLFDVYVNVKAHLPPDTPMSGFDNVGEGLAVSAEAARAYLIAADVTLDAAFGPAKQPTLIRHKTNLLDQKNHDGTPRLTNHIGKMFRQTDDGLVIFQSNYCPTNLVNLARLRPTAGTYHGTIRVRAIQSEKPVTLRIYGGDTIVGRREKHLVGYYDVPPDEWTTIEFTDRLVENGGTYQPKCYGTRDTRKDADSYPEPGIEIGDITIEGPLEEWPPRSRTMLLGDVDLQTGTLNDAEAILRRVLPLAFRRPTNDDEVKPYVTLVASALDADRPFDEALRLGLKGILCSPEFLFLDEPGSDVISRQALASRLSYFLWSSMPDDELLSLADKGLLDQPNILQQQVERLLNDPKAVAFTTNFVGQWLDLRDINFTEPDMNLYPEFDELLRLSMIEETHRYFLEVLERDLSLLTFIDSDFTFLNERLARHYEIPGVLGQRFRKITLPADSVRGGVLTQASVLKVTANGTNTSPVLRGVWVMENILGQPTPPPPSNVPAVEPDIRGATTLREQLARHRNEESCAVCHDKLDPAGFALESFDVIGGWRKNYRTLGDGERPGFSQHPITYAWIRYRIGLPVDATGKTSDGQSFGDIREFKQLLLRQKNSIATGLTEKLLTYALGRRVGFSDRQDIQKLVESSARNDYGFRSLIHEIVQSEMFRRP
ncbi:MAG: DUF1592 domain-containing protein [Fuerstiella sp.]